MAPIHPIDVPTLCFDAAVPTDRIGYVWGAPRVVFLGGLKELPSVRILLTGNEKY